MPSVCYFFHLTFNHHPSPHRRQLIVITKMQDHSYFCYRLGQEEWASISQLLTLLSSSTVIGILKTMFKYVIFLNLHYNEGCILHKLLTHSGEKFLMCCVLYSRLMSICSSLLKLHVNALIFNHRNFIISSFFVRFFLPFIMNVEVPVFFIFFYFILSVIFFDLHASLLNIGDGAMSQNRTEETSYDLQTYN